MQIYLGSAGISCESGGIAVPSDLWLIPISDLLGSVPKRDFTFATD
jgi:hypothetical protein